MTDFIILMGLQASGKSSFFRERFAGTHRLISKDLLKNNRRKGRRQRSLILEALEEGAPIAVDNTHPLRAERLELIELARQYGRSVTGYYFESVVKDCLSRNAGRSDGVPEVAIFSTIKKYEWPRSDEGYDSLYYVKLSDGGFMVEPWEDEK